MANQLKMEIQSTINTLYNQGWSQRRISRELGVDRKSVRRCIDKLKSSLDSKSPGAITGKVGEQGELTQSKCLSFASQIECWRAEGLSVKRIHQDLRAEHGFRASYGSVLRYVQKLEEASPERFERMECEPGQEAQVDYGTMHLLELESGRLGKVHLFRITLSHSRKSYSEAVFYQTTESFIRSIENGFRHFGGVPQRLCLDNLKAAVSKADWYEPELNPKMRSFAKHYDIAVMPTRPYTPQHKGKIESGIKYLKDNALKGKRFQSLSQLNAYLRHWEADIADCRIHGTTKQQVKAHFLAAEKEHLASLPSSLFPCFEEGERIVHRDSYIEVQRAYYELPQQYIGRRVWARWDGRMVRIYDQKMQSIGTYARLEPGQFSRILGPEGVRGSVAASTIYFRNQVARFGEQAAIWADAIIANDPTMAIRRLQGFLSLSKRYGKEQLNRACEKSILNGQYQLRDLRNYLQNAQSQNVFSFLEQHEIIRDMSAYGAMTQGIFS